MSRSHRSRKRPWNEPHRDLKSSQLSSLPRIEIGPDGFPYKVQYLRSSKKNYICPGCYMPIRAGSPNVVVWPEEAPLGWDRGIEARRHWHVSCWGRRLKPQ